MDMTNEEIIKICKETFNLQDALIGVIGQTVLAVKSEDIKNKIEGVLVYLDCAGTKDDVRLGFRIFAKELLKIIDK